jgi:hypothetical protein
MMVESMECIQIRPSFRRITLMDSDISTLFQPHTSGTSENEQMLWRIGRQQQGTQFGGRKLYSMAVLRWGIMLMTGTGGRSYLAAGGWLQKAEQREQRKFSALSVA